MVWVLINYLLFFLSTLLKLVVLFIGVWRKGLEDIFSQGLEDIFSQGLEDIFS